MIRTRVGYTGGRKPNPTYYSLGQHTETLAIDYDPSLIDYETLLTHFWEGHNPTRPMWSRQYMSALFVHDERQAELAAASKAAQAERRGGPIHTEIIPAERFYWAEDYHQKYLLRQTATLIGEFQAMYPHLTEFVNSTAVTRANAYVGGYGSLAMLEAELDSYGLSADGQAALRQIGQRFHKK